MKPKNQEGIILIIGAMAMLGVFIILGIIYDFGLVLVTKGELQNIADTASLRGAKELGAIYWKVFDDQNKLGNDPAVAQQGFILDSGHVTRISNAISDVVEDHLAAGSSITIQASDIVIGPWPADPFVGGNNQPNAVQVTARRDASVTEGAVTLIFGRMFNMTELDVQAKSIAALTPLNRVPPAFPGTSGLPGGDIIFPIGIDEDYGPFCPPPGSPLCNNPADFFNGCINIDPSIQSVPSCTAWTTFNDSFAGSFSNILAGSPPSSTGTSSPMTRTIFDGDPDDPVDLTPPGDGVPGYFFHGDALDQAGAYAMNSALMSVPVFDYMEVLIPVYQTPDAGCATPDGSVPLKISGFVSARLRPRGATGIQMKFACGVVKTGRSGGQNNFGTFGTEPVLVVN